MVLAVNFLPPSAPLLAKYNDGSEYNGREVTPRQLTDNSRTSVAVWRQQRHGEWQRRLSKSAVAASQQPCLEEKPLPAVPCCQKWQTTSNNQNIVITVQRQSGRRGVALPRQCGGWCYNNLPAAGFRTASRWRRGMVAACHNSAVSFFICKRQSTDETINRSLCRGKAVAMGVALPSVALWQSTTLMTTMSRPHKRESGGSNGNGITLQWQQRLTTAVTADIWGGVWLTASQCGCSRFWRRKPQAALGTKNSFWMRNPSGGALLPISGK